MPNSIDIENIFNHWISTSDRDFDTMNHLYISKDFSWALFIGHIVIERLLKASVVKQTSDHAPFTHDLTKLATLSELPFSEEQMDQLDTILHSI